MRIAQVAPLFESVPPKCYGGTERVVSYLTEELVRLGHDVTLFASADSTTAATLIPCAPTALRSASGVLDPMAYHVIMLEEVFRRLGDFDIIHFHSDYLHFPLCRRSSGCFVTTLHGRQDIGETILLHGEFAGMPLVSISLAQRRPLKGSVWIGNVYHGLPEDLYNPETKTGSYLVFLGRISPEKRVDRAIEIAQRAGLPLKIMAKIDKADREYYEREVVGLLSMPGIEFLGEGDELAKEELLRNAYALLMPIDWPEPFGLVMIEAFACGTPVVAFDNGSVSEVLDDGITGFVVNDVAEAVDALDFVGELDRKRVRRVFKERFSARRMAEDYVALYRLLNPCLSDANPALIQ